MQKVTGVEVGSVRMVGLDVPGLLDKRLLEYDFVYGGTGNPACTLKIEPQALNQVVAIFD